MKTKNQVALRLDVPCIVKLVPKIEPKTGEEIICGPFSTREAAERFATALAEGGCIQWNARVAIQEWNQ